MSENCDVSVTGKAVVLPIPTMREQGADEKFRGTGRLSLSTRHGWKKAVRILGTSGRLH